MRLIKEVAQDLLYIVEDKQGGGKNVYIEGIFAQAEKPNRNNRSYGKGIMEREVQKYQELINQKRSLGELGHPENPSINLHQVSHLITSLKMEGNDVIGNKEDELLFNECYKNIPLCNKKSVGMKGWFYN